MTDRRYGGFWRRVFAFLIDQIILYFLSMVMFLIGLLAFGLQGDLMGRALSSPGDVTHGMSALALIYLAASLLAGMTYFTWFHGAGGRTPGKMLLGLRVIQASGDPMTPGVAFLRWVGYLISGPVFGLGYLWVAFDRRKQGWHDKIAATLVIRNRGKSDRADGETTPPSFDDTRPSADEPDTNTKVIPSIGNEDSHPSDETPKAVVPPPEQPKEKPDPDLSLPLS